MKILKILPNLFGEMTKIWIFLIKKIIRNFSFGLFNLKLQFPPPQSPARDCDERE